MSVPTSLIVQCVIQLFGIILSSLHLVATISMSQIATAAAATNHAICVTASAREIGKLHWKLKIDDECCVHATEQPFGHCCTACADNVFGISCLLPGNALLPAAVYGYQHVAATAM